MSRSPGTLAAANITKYHGAQLVLRDVTRRRAAGARIGLVGPNGVGKSTLLRILAGPRGARRAAPSAARPRGSPSATCRRRRRSPGETLLAYLAPAHGRRGGRARARRARRAARRRAGARGAHAEALDALPRARRRRPRGAGAATRRASSASTSRSTRRSRALSGGEAARARSRPCCSRRFDVFLLDEPTNDLDFAGLDAARAVPRGSSSGAAVIVSHDRDFLDRTVDARRRARRVAAGRGRVRRRLERVRARARAPARAARTRRTRRYDGEKARLEEQRAADAALGGARLRPGAQEEEDEGREEGRSASGSSGSSAVEKPYEPWQLRLEPRPRPSRSGDVVVRLERRGRRARLVPSRPDRSRARLGRPARGRRPERQRQDDAARRAARAAAARGRARAGSGPASCSASSTSARELAGASRCSRIRRASRLSPEEARTLLAKFGLGADDVCRGARRSRRASGRAPCSRCSSRAASTASCSTSRRTTSTSPAIEELERALGRLRRHGGARHPRPAVPRAFRAYADAGALNRPGSRRSSRASLTGMPVSL